MSEVYASVDMDVLYLPKKLSKYEKVIVSSTDRLGDKIEAMDEKSLVSVKLEPGSICRLSSVLFILPLFYLRD